MTSNEPPGYYPRRTPRPRARRTATASAQICLGNGSARAPVTTDAGPSPVAGCAVPSSERTWVVQAVRFLTEERQRADETPLVAVPCPELPDITIMLKDESTHPSGSLKHRLAQALFVHAICNGDIGPETVIIEASSGSTAISEAWFARQLGLSFVAVVPRTTVPAKISAIRAQGGEIVLAGDGEDLCELAARIAIDRGGFFMDQFGRAAEATDWRGANNIAENMMDQIYRRGLDAPAWFVTGAGTGGTSATIGRYLRLRPELARTRLCVVDPDGSAYFKAFVSGDCAIAGRSSPIVEGIGRGRVASAFQPGVIDQMIAVADSGSVAGALWLAERTDRRFGPSSGTNLIGALLLGQAMQRRGEAGTIVMLGCDGGDRYHETIYNPLWCEKQGLVLEGWNRMLARLGSPAFPAAY